MLFKKMYGAVNWMCYVCLCGCVISICVDVLCLSVGMCYVHLCECVMSICVNGFCPSVCLSVCGNVLCQSV